jgi:hypothetical protein
LGINPALDQVRRPGNGVTFKVKGGIEVGKQRALFNQRVEGVLGLDQPRMGGNPTSVW